jgi:putative ABC transport system permease protein
VQAKDGATVAFVIAVITVVASWLPAWHASRVDPNVVLKEE